MGWNSKSVLESVGLIYSEVGECFEVLNDSLYLPSELADIVIRCTNLAMSLGADLDAEILKAAALPRFSSKSPAELLGLITIPLKDCVNACRKGVVEPEFCPKLGEAVFVVFQICQLLDVDILEAVDRKMTINYARGNRGRLV